MNPTLVFLLLERRGRNPFPIQGLHSGKTYATAYHDDQHGGHVFKMPLDEWVKCGRVIVAGSNRPLCSFMPVDVELPADLAAVTAERDALVERLAKYEKPRERWNFKDYVAHAKRIGMPRYSMLAKSGNREAFVTAVEEYEAATAQNSSGNQARTEGASQAA